MDISALVWGARRGYGGGGRICLEAHTKISTIQHENLKNTNGVREKLLKSSINVAFDCKGSI